MGIAPSSCDAIASVCLVKVTVNWKFALDGEPIL